jgi:hypothetical protein
MTRLFLYLSAEVRGTRVAIPSKGRLLDSGLRYHARRELVKPLPACAAHLPGLGPGAAVEEPGQPVGVHHELEGGGEPGPAGPSDMVGSP